MPLLAVKVIVITALVGVAVGTALYENHPPFRNWVDDRFDEFRQHTQPMRADSGYTSDDDDEKNREARGWELGRTDGHRDDESEDEEDNNEKPVGKKMSDSSTTSDDFMDVQDRSVEEGVTTGHDVAQSSSTLRQRNMAQLGFDSGSTFANPFDDQASVLFDRDDNHSTTTDTDSAGQVYDSPDRPPTPPPRPAKVPESPRSVRSDTTVSNMSYASIPSPLDEGANMDDEPAAKVADGDVLATPEPWTETTVSAAEESMDESEPSLIDWEDTMSTSAAGEHVVPFPHEHDFRLVDDGVESLSSEPSEVGSPQTPRARPVVGDDAFSTGSWDSFSSNESFGDFR